MWRDTPQNLPRSPCTSTSHTHLTSDTTPQEVTTPSSTLPPPHPETPVPAEEIHAPSSPPFVPGTASAPRVFGSGAAPVGNQGVNNTSKKQYYGVPMPKEFSKARNRAKAHTKLESREIEAKQKMLLMVDTPKKSVQFIFWSVCTPSRLSFFSFTFSDTPICSRTAKCTLTS